MRRRPGNMSHRIHWWRCRRFVRWIGRQTSSSVRIVRVELLYSNPGYFHLIPSPSGGWWCATTKGRIPNTGSYLRKWDHLSMKYQRGCSSLYLSSASSSSRLPGQDWLLLNGNNDDVVWRIVCREWIFVKTHSTLKIYSSSSSTRTMGSRDTQCSGA